MNKMDYYLNMFTFYQSDADILTATSTNAFIGFLIKMIDIVVHWNWRVHGTGHEYEYEYAWTEKWCGCQFNMKQKVWYVWHNWVDNVLKY